MALPPHFLEELRARTPLASLIGRRVKLARSGRQWKGCCPFHGEKSPSFYVYDDHFHCFGCGVHGDAISFVMQGGAGFMEAVEQLAGEAGLEVPKPTPQAAEAERRRHDLHSVLDAALAFFARKLREPEGRPGLDYLRGRGLTDDTIARFGLGWAGEGRGALAAELARDNVAPAMLEEAGLMRAAEDGKPARDQFYNRVMFPIRDRRGRVISFGGRILGDGQPKYVNGPETPVFSKRRTLYALDLAREGVRAGGRLVAVEGYMDVIALHQAGITGAVAPLGTALTAEQLEEMWRLSPEPVLCFDGDGAGRRAALRAMDVALPTLAPDRTLRVALMQDGEDPDSLVRRGGAPAFRAVLEAARPLAETLFDALRESASDATPEGRAAFRAKLMETAGRIGDKGLASEYRRALLDRVYAQRAPRPNRDAGGRNGRAPFKPPPRAAQRPLPDGDSAFAERARNLAAILLRHPGLLPDVEEAWCTLHLAPPLHALRHQVLHWAETAQTLESAALTDHLRVNGLTADAAQVLSAVPKPLPACARLDAMPAEAEAGWWHFFGLMHRDRLEEEVASARRDFEHRPDDEAALRRLTALSAARSAIRRGEQGMDGDA